MFDKWLTRKDVRVNAALFQIPPWCLPGGTKEKHTNFGQDSWSPIWNLNKISFAETGCQHVKLYEVIQVGFFEHGDKFPNQANEYQLLMEETVQWSYTGATVTTALHFYAHSTCLTIMLTWMSAVIIFAIMTYTELVTRNCRHLEGNETVSLK